ncbi:MAG: cache domain-containing protein, partial [Psychrosphaera sp.]|nr:cache domain-containing protein [Psychrosphaera sp.]
MIDPVTINPVKHSRTLKTKLIGTILVLSIVPLLLSSWLTFDSYMSSMKGEALKQLVANRNFKQFQLSDYFKDLKDQTLVFAGDNASDNTIQDTKGVALTLTEFQAASTTLAGSHLDFVGLTDLFNTNDKKRATTGVLNRSYYDALHAEIQPNYSRFADKAGLQNIFLVAALGQVVYSINKTKAFGTNLMTGPQVNGALAQAFASVSKQNEAQPIIFHDYSLNPDSSTYSAYIAIAKFDFGHFLGAIIYQIPLTTLKRLIGDSIELGATGKVLVIGDDGLIRAAQQGTGSNELIGHEAVHNTTAFGQRFEGNSAGEQRNDSGQVFLEVSAPLKVFDRQWS